MRSFVRQSLITLVLGALFITAAYPEFEQTAQARSVANRFRPHTKIIPVLRGNRDESPEVFNPATQTITTRTLSVSPNSVNVYSQGATSVLLTYTGVINLQPLEATFCDELVPVFAADPSGFNAGFKCKPGTSLGRLPQRYDQSTLSKHNTFTDVLSVTPEIARRAYLKVAGGKRNRFFYVRRFINSTTFREAAVPVTLQLSGNGADVPLSLTEVKLKWGDVAKPIIFIKTTDELPQVKAEIIYTGTGRLKGRWELVKPGDIPPTSRDLLSEAAMPFEERPTHRRYTEMSRFNIYLPPTGKVLLPGPEVGRMDKTLTGLYQILLRIEATEDTAGIVAAPGLPRETALDAALRKVPSGGVAGFSLPRIKYYVSNGSMSVPPASANPLGFAPEDQATINPDQPVDFMWPLDDAATYRLEIEDLQSASVISAILPAGVSSYRAPSWFKDKVGQKVVRWRVTSFDQQGNVIDKTEWRSVRFELGTGARHQQP
jgi:hypothetical protein